MLVDLDEVPLAVCNRAHDGRGQRVGCEAMEAQPTQLVQLHCLLQQPHVPEVEAHLTRLLDAHEGT